MNSDLFAFILQFLPVIFFLILGLTAGTITERRHFASIRERESRLQTLPAITLSKTPENWSVESSGLVAGGVVVSLDYFKRFAAAFRILVGGRVKSFEPLLDRGRREALLRMKQEASEAGYDAVINVRLQTARIANSDGSTTAGVEMLAYGTGLRLRGNPFEPGHAVPAKNA